MRLWHKLFAVVLLLVMIGVQVTAVSIIHGDFKNSINSVISNVRSEQKIISATMTNRIKKDIKSGDLFLDEKNVRILLANIIKEEFADNIAIYCDDELISENSDDNIFTNFNGYLSNNSQIEAGEEKVYIIDNSEINKKYVYGQSVINILGRDYVIYHAIDITNIYNNYQNNLKNSRILTLIVSIITAFTTFIIVYAFTRPISKITNEMQQIINGNYSARITAKGSYEFKMLADSINEMAASAQENMESVQDIAESRKTFIDNFAHEMKTPLTSIMGFGDILRIKKNLSDKQRIEYANIIVDEAKRLKGLSGKLLELTTAGSCNLEFEEVNASELLKEVDVAVLPVIIKAGMKLELSCDDTIKLLVDKELMKSLVYNLIDNAIKASKPGNRIKVNCYKSKDKNIISVSDEGIGMSKNDIKRVVEPFYMVDKSRSRKAGGAGLGLALCLEIAKQHDGRIKIKSVLNKGTTVMIILNDKFLDKSIPSSRKGGEV